MADINFHNHGKRKKNLQEGEITTDESQKKKAHHALRRWM